MHKDWNQLCKTLFAKSSYIKRRPCIGHVTFALVAADARAAAAAVAMLPSPISNSSFFLSSFSSSPSFSSSVVSMASSLSFSKNGSTHLAHHLSSQCIVLLKSHLCKQLGISLLNVSSLDVSGIFLFGRPRRLARHKKPNSIQACENLEQTRLSESVPAVFVSPPSLSSSSCGSDFSVVSLFSFSTSAGFSADSLGFSASSLDSAWVRYHEQCKV